MKHIFFIRHAKSSWEDYRLDDHDRPLNKRGKRDAPNMARRLVGLDPAPQGILTSTAKRAKVTAKVFRDAFGLTRDEVIAKRCLYHAMPEAIEEEICCLPDEWETVLVFGHNPGYTYLANQLQHDRTIGNVPTCGIVGAKIDIDKWENFTLAAAIRTTFMYPKEVL